MQLPTVWLCTKVNLACVIAQPPFHTAGQGGQAQPGSAVKLLTSSLFARIAPAALAAFSAAVLFAALLQASVLGWGSL